MNCSMPGFLVQYQLLELAQIHVHRISDAIQSSISSSVIPFSSCLQSFPVSGSFLRSQFFTSGGQSIGASALASVLSMNFRTDFFRIDWFDPLAVQGTLKSLFHSSKASVLWLSAFFMIQFSHPHMTTGKTIALTRWTFVGKVMSPLFNMLSRFVLAFLPRSKRLLISWLQSLSAVILEPKKIKSVTVSIVSLSICHEVMGLDANEAEVDAFLELFCFFYDPMDVGNLISGSSAVSKYSLNIRNFSVHILLKPIL